MQSGMVVKKRAGDRAAEESPLSLAEKGVTAEKSLSLVAKGGTAEAARLRRNLLGPLIKCIFNLLFVATLAGYVFIVREAFNYFPMWPALAAVGIASPYFIVMLIAIPLLKEVYIEQYGNATL